MERSEKTFLKCDHGRVWKGPSEMQSEVLTNVDPHLLISTVSIRYEITPLEISLFLSLFLSFFLFPCFIVHVPADSETHWYYSLQKNDYAS